MAIDCFSIMIYCHAQHSGMLYLICPHSKPATVSKKHHTFQNQIPNISECLDLVQRKSLITGQCAIRSGSSNPSKQGNVGTQSTMWPSIGNRGSATHWRLPQ